MATKSLKSAETASQKPLSQKSPTSKKESKKTSATKVIAKAEKPKATKSVKSAEPASATRKKRAPKTTSSKISSSVALDPKPPVKEPVIPNKEISLRAYFIAERRQKMGWPGDSATDWLDAESQLRAEALEKPLKKR